MRAEYQLKYRAGRNVDRLVRGQHGQTTTLKMCADQSCDQIDGGGIECHERFVKQPQGAAAR